MPTTTPFDNLITFSRGSNATVTGPNGLIQWAPNNLLTFSEQFDNAAWVKANFGVASVPTVTANFGTAPDGSVTADRVQLALNGGNTTTARALVSQSVAIATSVPYTFSIWLRSLSGSVSMGIGCDNVAGNTPVTVTPTWQRFTLTGTSTGSPALAWFQLRGGLTPTQSDTADILVWGAQLEIGSTATTYNPTTVKNLLGFSEAFDNAGWSKTAVSMVTGAQANPINGLFNAQKLMETTANNSHVVQQAVTVANGVTHVASVYAKAGERSWLTIGTVGFGTGYTYFNLTNGTIGTVLAGHTASITAIGNGWYRCSIAATSTTTSAVIYYGTTSTNGVSNYTGDGNSGVYIYGAQLSDSASLDPYVPTPGAAPSSTAFYGPRFDFDPVTLQPRGLLVEEQRTNLFTYSDDFANAAWTKSSATVTANQAVSPDGTTNADLLQITAQFGRLQAGSVTLGTVYTFSIWARTATGTRVYSLYDAAGNPIGTLTATTTWTRHTITFTAPATSTLYVMQDRNAAPFVDTFIYGAQLEAGAFATSYIPTVASTVTRNADSPSITGSNFSGWFNAAAGAFVADFSVSGIDASSRRKVWNGIDSGNQRLALRSTDTAPTFPLGAVGTGTSVVSLNGAPMTANIPAKVALAYGANSALSQNGLTTATDANVNSVAPTSFGIGWDQIAIGQYLNGHIRSIRYIPARAADFQLQALTELPLVPTLDLDFLNNLYEA